MELRTRYLGLELQSPLVASASPLNAKLDVLKELADQGAGAVVLPSVFEEQIWHEQRILDQLVEHGSESFGEALSYFPTQAAFAFESSNHLALVEKAAATLPIPVIASINGTTDSGWTDLAHDLAEAGAAAIELNVYFLPTDPEVSGSDVERRTLDVVRAVRDTVEIPLAVKIGPYFSAPAHMARRIVAAGADGVVLFNRFYQPDIDPVGLTVTPSLELSRRYEMRLPLLWIGVLSGRIAGSIAATTGVETSEDVVRYLLAGADVVMTTSALLRHGPAHMGVLRRGLEDWLAVRGLAGPGAIRGQLGHGAIADGDGYERANYIKVMQSWQKS
ncbi:dihydroorotate dehydrogenase-like protein [Rhodobacter maris]|uniref:Dihydroorotate dehydrogenase (Fumarate) n=1 Tax=Rhodobacter maris TaxID=446682 RepID=A0A285SJK3_9RHOB|nr:dihydroorotate dehydrogenase-like protein [Rhodobacter maris]SOC07759.1 dihydroorotate dehydrogenase (fumarate) [Rhodobacter maris]